MSNAITVRIDKDAKMLHITLPLKDWFPLPGSHEDWQYVFSRKAEAGLRALLRTMEDAVLTTWPVDGSQGNPFFDL